MTGAPKANKITNTAVTDIPQVADTNTTKNAIVDTPKVDVVKTATTPTNNVSEDNEDIFAGLNFGFGDE